RGARGAAGVADAGGPGRHGALLMSARAAAVAARIARVATLLAVVTVAAGCGGGIFDPKIDTEYACSPTGGCPPGFQCVPGEHICRQPCVTPQTGINNV